MHEPCCFTVFTNEKGLPQGIQFTGQKEYLVFPVEDAIGMSSEADWICLLALWTATVRAGHEERSHLPCLSELNKDHAKSIAEALCNKRLFNEFETNADERGGDETENDGGEEKRDTRHWLLKIFGASPRGKFLEGTRTSGSAKVMFLENVEIRIIGRKQSDNDEDIEEKESTPLTNPDVINKIYEKSKLYLASREARAFISLHCLDRGHPMSPESILNSRSERRSLDSNSLFRIRVRTNYRCEIALFWITSAKKIWPVYPFNDLKKNPGFDKSSDGINYDLTIGTEFEFEVHPPEGFDHCLVVERNHEYTKKDMTKIAKLIEKSIRDQHFAGSIKNSNPVAQTLRIAKTPAQVTEKSYTDSRFGTSEGNKKWTALVAKNLVGKAARMHILTIPNRQP